MKDDIPVVGGMMKDHQKKHEDNPMRDEATRYAAYLARAKLVLARATKVLSQNVRYTAYSSDIGESLRPGVI